MLDPDRLGPQRTGVVPDLLADRIWSVIWGRVGIEISGHIGPLQPVRAPYDNLALKTFIAAKDPGVKVL